MLVWSLITRSDKDQLSCFYFDHQSQDFNGLPTDTHTALFTVNMKQHPQPVLFELMLHTVLYFQVKYNIQQEKM